MVKEPQDRRRSFRLLLLKASAVSLTISSKLIFASYVRYFDLAYYGFYVTSSKMSVLLERKKMWELWKSVSVQIRSMLLWICMQLCSYWLDVILFTAALGGEINGHVFGEHYIILILQSWWGLLFTFNTTIVVAGDAPSSEYLFIPHHNAWEENTFPRTWRLYLIVPNVVACLAGWCRGNTFPSPSIMSDDVDDIQDPIYHMNRWIFCWPVRGLTWAWMALRAWNDSPWGRATLNLQTTCHGFQPEPTPAPWCSGGLPPCHGA